MLVNALHVHLKTASPNSHGLACAPFTIRTMASIRSLCVWPFANAAIVCALKTASESNCISSYCSGWVFEQFRA